MPRREAGHTLLLVMVVSTVMLGLAATLADHVISVENRQVAASLARAQAYWAEHGLMDYILSRARQQGAAEADLAKVSQLTQYLDEMDGNANNDNRSFRFVYPEMGTNYALEAQGTVSLGQITASRDQVLTNAGNGLTDNGLLHVSLRIRETGEVPVLIPLPRERTLEINLCMRPEPDEGTGHDPLITSQCPDFTAPGQSGQAWVREFYRSFP